MTTLSSSKRLVIGNWKMHGSLEANAQLLSDIQAGAGILAEYCTVVVCPPFPYLAQAAAALKGSAVSWGAQDVSVRDQGAYTGEVSAAMLKDFNCSWVLVGHSERRAMHGESDQLVADKAKAALKAGITPVVCVGETLEQREAEQTYSVIERQLAPVLALGKESVERLVIAYEPVWAIGTGRTATPEVAQDVHARIRERLATVGASDVRILYGGSVKASNAASLFAMRDVDGALVGGAALVAQDFLHIAAA